MVKGKFWVVAAAVAAMSFTGISRAATSSSADALTLSTPTYMQTEKARKPLMWGLDQVGLAAPLDDARIDIGGYVSASTTFYIDRADSKFQNGRAGFDAEDQDPTLNQLGVFFDRSVDQTKGEFDIGGRIEWIWGGDARFIHSTGLFDYNSATNGPDEQFDPVQAYLDIALPVQGLKLKAGKFVTPAGVETINPTTNALFSRGLLFTYLLPFTHTGLIASYQANDAWLFEGGVIRGWDDSLEDKNADGVSFLGRAVYSYDDKKSTAYLNLIVGPEFAENLNSTRSLVDIVYTHKYSENWTFAVQADLLWETDEDGNGPSTDDGIAFGLGGWASYMFSEYFTFNGRAEYLYDGDAIRFGAFNPVLGVDADGNPTAVSSGANNVYSLALGVTITPFPTDNLGSNLKLRPEIRYDYAEDAVFGGDNNQFTFAIEGYFTF
jgi:hypothetical protein